MGFNPFGDLVQTTVPKGAKPRVIDNSNLIIYNILMQRYYEVGRDYSNGLITNRTAKFHFEDIAMQLAQLRLKRMENSLRKQIEELLERVQTAIEHTDDSPSSHF